MAVKSQESISPCELSLDIEVETSKVAAAVDKAYREFSKYVNVPGFRPGKAPISFVRQRVPQDKVRERAAELLFGPAYEEAIKETEITPYARPKVELVKMETAPPDYVFEFKAIVPLAPKVEPGNYKGLEVEREISQVSDSDVDEQINSLRDRNAEYPLIEDRPSQMGDVVVGELSITPHLMDQVEGEEPIAGDFRQTAITIGDAGNVPGVDQHLIGLNKGDEKKFTLTYPEDYPQPEVAGQVADFSLRVAELHTRIVAELDDEFAKKVGGVDTLEALRTKIRADQEKIAAETAETKVENSLIDMIVASSQIDYPSVLLDVEVEDDIKTFNETLERNKTTFEEYKDRTGMTEEILLEQFKGRAEKRLRRGLVLGEIARLENLALTDEDVTREIEARAAAQRTSVQSMRAYIDTSKTMESVRNAAYTKKMIAFLLSSASIKDVAPKSPDASEGETPVEQAVAAKPVKAATPRKKKAAAGAEAAEDTSAAS